MLYDCYLVLMTGEIRHLPEIKCISWLRSRIMFTNVDDETEYFRAGEIVKCEMIIQKGDNNNEFMGQD